MRHGLLFRSFAVLLLLTLKNCGDIIDRYVKVRDYFFTHHERNDILMKNRKKLQITKAAALLAALMIMLSLAACGVKPTEGFSSDSLYIVYGGKAYKVGDKADKLVKALGAPSNTISQASCHYGENGDEYTYEYYLGSGAYNAVSGSDSGDYTDFSRYADTLRIHTVPLKPGADYICDIDCYTSAATTDKGITVGSAREDVFKAYGDHYVDEGDGFYRYYDGEALPDTPSLMFYMPGGKVVFFSVSAAINF